jgi:hypothetical protein
MSERSGEATNTSKAQSKTSVKPGTWDPQDVKRFNEGKLNNR